MNKKGFTVIELIVSISLTLVISVFLVQIVLALDNLYNNSGIKTELLTKQSLISSQINSKLNEKTISSLTSCGSYCLKFNYTDSTNDILKINYSNNTLEFGSFYTKLPEDSYFKDVSIDVVYGATIQNNVNNAMLNISIPILNNDIEGEFGVNIVYQFNSDITNIEYVDFANKGSYIVLNGDTEQTFNTKTAYVEQGYTVYDSNGNVITGNVEVDNPLTSVPYKAGNYKIKYSLKDNNGNIISQTTRSIKVTPSTYDITNMIVNGSFEDGFTGWNSNLFNKGGVVLSNSYKTSGNNSIYVEAIGDGKEKAAGYLTEINVVSNHKYYFSIDSYLEQFQSSSGVLVVLIDSSGQQNRLTYDKNMIGKWQKNSKVFTPSINTIYSDIRVGAVFSTPTVPSVYKAYADSLILIDLTETFGAGNEPTKEWCDENINWFEGTTKINY